MTKRILVIDACVRRTESRTEQLLEKALKTLKELHEDWEFEYLMLPDLNLAYWNTDTLKKRDALLAQQAYEDPAFRYGNQFREADGIVVAAPFWDLSIPAVLKVYIENISADGVTFQSTPEGLKGLCRAEWMLFLTTRGGIYEGTDMEQGCRYMEAISRFFGIKGFYKVSADGMDAAGLDKESIMERAMEETVQVCREL